MVRRLSSAPCLRSSLKQRHRHGEARLEQPHDRSAPRASASAVPHSFFPVLPTVLKRSGVSHTYTGCQSNSGATSSSEHGRRRACRLALERTAFLLQHGENVGALLNTILLDRLVDVDALAVDCELARGRLRAEVSLCVNGGGGGWGTAALRKHIAAWASRERQLTHVHAPLILQVRQDLRGRESGLGVNCV